jgi:hypothetical protein
MAGRGEGSVEELPISRSTRRYGENYFGALAASSSDARMPARKALDRQCHSLLDASRPRRWEHSPLRSMRLKPSAIARSRSEELFNIHMSRPSSSLGIIEPSAMARTRDRASAELTVYPHARRMARHVYLHSLSIARQSTPPDVVAQKNREGRGERDLENCATPPEPELRGRLSGRCAPSADER